MHKSAPPALMAESTSETSVPIRQPQSRRRSSLYMQREVASSNSRVQKDAKRKLDLAMQLKKGLKIKDRRWLDLKLYKQCFLHNDAIEYLMQQQGVTEEEAVRLANELVEAQYVTHVCNDHGFTVGESRTLFFKFREDVIEADMIAVASKGVDTNVVMNQLGEELESLKTKLNRLVAESVETDLALEEMYAKMAIMESVVVSLGFSTVALVVSMIAVLVLNDKVSHHGIKIIFTCLVALLMPVVVMYWNMSSSSRIRGNVVIWNKLFAASGSLEDVMESMATDVEEMSITKKKDRAITDVSKTQQPSLRRRESLVQQVMRSFSQRKSQVIQIRDASDLPDPSNWPHRPALVCANTPVSPSLQVPKYGTGPCPIGVPFDFSTDLFEGKCLIRLRDVPSDDEDGDAEYFDGRKRKFQAIVQGRFKEELSVADVMTGHEFRPLNRLPPAWLIRAGTSFIRRIAPGTDIVLNKHESRAMSLLAATSQVVSVDPVGNEPEITNCNIEEEMSLFGGIFADGDVSVYKRKHYLAKPQNAEQYCFNTESVYTFDFYQNLLDVATYSLDLGTAKIGLTKFLDGQPIQVMSKTTDGRYLWSFQVWHEDLLPQD